MSNASNVYQISDFDDSLKHIHIWQVRKKLLYTICKIKSKHVLQTIFSKMLAWSFMNNFNHDTHFVNRTSHAKLCVLHTAFQICSTNARKWTLFRDDASSKIETACKKNWNLISMFGKLWHPDWKTVQKQWKLSICTTLNSRKVPLRSFTLRHTVCYSCDMLSIYSILSRSNDFNALSFYCLRSLKNDRKTMKTLEMTTFLFSQCRSLKGIRRFFYFILQDFLLRHVR